MPAANNGLYAICLPQAQHRHTAHSRSVGHKQNSNPMRILIILTISLLFGFNVNGQEFVEIHGKVISKNGIPLPGTSKVLKSNRLVGTITDACGQFRLQIPRDRNDYLMLSMISEPFYFDLNKIENKDLNKSIVFRIVPFNEGKKSKNWKNEITIECDKYKKQKKFKLTDKNRKWLKRK